MCFSLWYIAIFLLVHREILGKCRPLKIQEAVVSESEWKAAIRRSCQSTVEYNGYKCDTISNAVPVARD